MNQARHQSQASARTARPATQKAGRCDELRCLPRRTTVDVPKCHACHAKPSVTSDQRNHPRQLSQPSALSATSAHMLTATYQRSGESRYDSVPAKCTEKEDIRCHHVCITTCSNATYNMSSWFIMFTSRHVLMRHIACNHVCITTCSNALNSMWPCLQHDMFECAKQHVTMCAWRHAVIQKTTMHDVWTATCFPTAIDMSQMFDKWHLVMQHVTCHDVVMVRLEKRSVRMNQSNKLCEQTILIWQ